MTNSPLTLDAAQAAIDQITERAAKDADFRTLCLTSPAEAVREATGRDLPAGFTLRFVDNAHADLTIILPDAKADDALSDNDLESVAGGTDSGTRARLLAMRAYRDELLRKQRDSLG